jgi:hypothetical protein
MTKELSKDLDWFEIKVAVEMIIVSVAEVIIRKGREISEISQQ